MDCQLKFMVQKPPSIMVTYLYPFHQHNIYNHLMPTEYKFPPLITDHSLFAKDLLWAKKNLHLFTNISQQGISILSTALSQMICSDTLRCLQIMKTEHYDFHVRFPVAFFSLCTQDDGGLNQKRFIS